MSSKRPAPGQKAIVADPPGWLSVSGIAASRASGSTPLSALSPRTIDKSVNAIDK